MSKEQIIDKKIRKWTEICEAEVMECMDEYAKQQVFEFLKFKKEYQLKEKSEVAKEYVKMGGIFSWIGASDEIIYEKFLQSHNPY